MAIILDYVKFRDQYEQQHPASVPKKPKVGLKYPTWLQGAVMAMFLSAVLLSAVHTIPTMFDAIPQSDVIADWVRRLAAHAAVFMLELSLFIAVYASALSRSWIYTTIEAVAFVGALAANLYSVLHTVDTDLGAVIVGVIIGSLPPMAAALSGAVYVRIHVANSKVRLEIEQAYQEQLKAWDTIILSAYRKHEKDTDRQLLSEQTDSRQTAQTAPALSAPVLSDQTDNRQVLRTAFGYDRTPDGQQTVISFLNDNPDAAKLPSRSLAALIGEQTGTKVGHDTANKGRNRWVETQQQLQSVAYENGHSA